MDLGRAQQIHLKSYPNSHLELPLGAQILTPKDNPATQLEILADIGSTLKDPELREKLVAVRGYTELLALLRADGRAR